MKVKALILLAFLVACVPVVTTAQNWSGILKPTSGTGACTLAPNDLAAACAIDWSQTGIPGGIPSGSWSQSGSTILASTYGNGSTDATSGIQAALNSCGTDHYVLLGAGTFLINSSVSIPSNCALRGSGANQTILSVHGNSIAPVTMGSGAVAYTNPIAVSSGATAGSTSLTLSSTSGVSAGSYLVVSETNNPAWVTIHGGEGDCTWCDGWSTSGTRSRGQIVEVENIAGNVVTISPALYTAYTNTPTVIPFSAAAKYAGLEDLQIYANDTGYGNMTYLDECAYCWVKGVEDNYTDGNFVEADWSYRGEIRNNYFSNAYVHAPGATDSDIFIVYKTSGFQVINNIVERAHVSIMLDWGAAGNVLAYNYTEGEFDAGSTNFVIGGISMHGAHPQFNLIEGNVANQYYPDQVWGSSSHNTSFRNWFEGTTRACTPTSGRGTVNCTGTNGWWTFQASRAAQIGHYSWYYNVVGDVLGSGNQQTLLPSGTLHLPNIPWDGVTLRSYDTTTYGFSFGFGESSDDGVTSDGCSGSTVSPCHSADAYKTSFIYNAFTYANSTTNCTSGGSASTCTAPLPPSFFLSSKPSWWTASIPWPAIGPDVTGGTGPGGHASLTASNPAQYCYLVTMGGSEGGAGSPLAFNEAQCYSNSSSGNPPAAPTGLSAVVQ